MSGFVDLPSIFLAAENVQRSRAQREAMAREAQIKEQQLAQQAQMQAELPGALAAAEQGDLSKLARLNPELAIKYGQELRARQQFGLEQDKRQLELNQGRREFQTQKQSEDAQFMQNAIKHLQSAPEQTRPDIAKRLQELGESRGIDPAQLKESLFVGTLSQNALNELGKQGGAKDAAELQQAVQSTLQSQAALGQKPMKAGQKLQDFMQINGVTLEDIQTNPALNRRANELLKSAGVNVTMPGADATQKTLNDAQTTLIKTQLATNRLEDIKGKFGVAKEFLTFQGKGKLWLAALKDKLNTANPEDKATLDRATEFHGAVMRYFTAALNALSGSAVSVEEAKRVKDGYINGEQSPQQFISQLNGLLEDNRQTAQLQRDILSGDFSFTNRERGRGGGGQQPAQQQEFDPAEIDAEARRRLGQGGQ